VSRASARTFILTLDTVQHLLHSIRERSGTYFQFSFVPYLKWQSSHRHNLIRSSATIAPEVVLTPPTLPAFYPHSDGPLWARCILGSDFKPRSITTMMDLGRWDAAIYRAISKGSGGFRSRPNKAVDVMVNQPSRSRSSRNEQNRFVFSLYAAADSVIVFGVLWPRG